LEVVPGGIEPPISSVSGRRLRHSTTGLAISEFGTRNAERLPKFRIPSSPLRVQNAPARSRTRTSSFEARRDVRFTTRASAEGEGVEPAFPARGNRVSTAARPPVSGYLPYQWRRWESNPPQSVCKTDSPTLGTCAPNSLTTRGRNRVRVGVRTGVGRGLGARAGARLGQDTAAILSVVLLIVLLFLILFLVLLLLLIVLLFCSLLSDL
jgi:hypothetical protein